jgi:small conductance mechanosensitive channel
MDDKMDKSSRLIDSAKEYAKVHKQHKQGVHDMEKVGHYINLLIEMALLKGPQILLAILVLFIGLSFISSLTRMLKGVLSKQKIDPTLIPFLSNLVGWGFKALLLISVASMVGIETTSFVAVIGAAGLAIGLALQGSLANFAGGVLILMFRPFKVGDYVKAQGLEGTVKSIDVFATVLTTIDNKKVVLPNGPLAGGAISNYTGHEIRRVDLSIGIGYDDDIRTACKVLAQMCESHPLVLKEPEVPFVGVTDYGDSSINLTIRSWTKTEHYWTVYFELNEKIKYTLDENKIGIPFPQRDVHIFNEK